MLRRKVTQRPGMIGPSIARNVGMVRNAGMQRRNVGMARNAGMQRRNVGMARKPKIRQRNQNTLARSGMAAAQIGALPAGAKPRTSLLLRIPGISNLINLLTGFFFPKSHLRVMQRKSVGTGLSVIRKRALNASERTQVLRNRTPGLPNTIATQHARGKIRGVPVHPGQKRAA